MKFDHKYFLTIQLGDSAPEKFGEISINHALEVMTRKFLATSGNTQKIQIRLSKDDYIAQSRIEELEAEQARLVAAQPPMATNMSEWANGIAWARHYEMIQEGTSFWDYNKARQRITRVEFTSAEIEEIKQRFAEEFPDILAAGILEWE